MPKRSALRTFPKHDAENNISVVDRVRFAIANNRTEELTEDEQKQFKRWLQISDWIRERRYSEGIKDEKEKMITSHRVLRNAVMSVFMVSYDTAERDIRNAKQVFVPIDDDNEYYRSVYIEQSELRADQAAAAGDFGASARHMDNAIKLRRLLEAPKEQMEYKKFQTVQFIIEYNPEAIGLKTIPDKEAVFARYQKRKASERMAAEAEDAKYDVG